MEWGKWQHFDQTCWRLFTKEIENVMLWAAHWNRSCCNVVVNISYQTEKKPRNVLKTFWKHFKMNRQRKKRFGNLKHSAKVKKDNIILVRRELLILLHICSSVKHASYVQHRFKVTLYFQVFSRKKVKFKFEKILVTCWANGSWQILFSSVTVHTRRSWKVKKSV